MRKLQFVDGLAPRTVSLKTDDKVAIFASAKATSATGDLVRYGRAFDHLVTLGRIGDLW